MTPVSSSMLIGLIALLSDAASACSSDSPPPAPPCHDESHGMAGGASNAPGQVTLGATITSCPQITSIGVVPARLPPGEEAALIGDAVDLDNDVLSLLWSAPAGTIAAPKSARTTYRCAGEGLVTLTLSVTDGNCEDKLQALVQCIP